MRYFIFLMACCCSASALGQSGISLPFNVKPALAEGLPIQQVVIVLQKDGLQVLADSSEKAAFYQAFQLKPGSSFRQSQADYALSVINRQSFVRSAGYELYNSSIGDPLLLVITVTYLKAGENKEIDGKKGMLKTNSLRDFPLLYQSSKAQVSFILNGGVGLYNEVNPFFGEGAAFTAGNPAATDPAGKGTRFWGETYLEPGLAGITKIGKSKTFLYGAGSVLISGRNSSDIYSEGSTVFAAFERLYGGILLANLGKKKNLNIDFSAGRQFFQLNDGFLISKYSGSANAGDRGSVYLSSRTAFQKTALLKAHWNNWQVQGFFLEPQELYKNRQSNTAYTGVSFAYAKKTVDAGITYFTVSGGKANYPTPTGNIPKKGMYIINPKIWLTDIAKTGLFIKSEYAFQSHGTADFRSNAWYIGAGLKKNKWKFHPSLYYRYAFMQGDDTTTARYEKFDPVLTGGLGNWVQGIDFRKLIGNGNIISHRIELKGNLTKSWEVSIDYFHLQSHTLANLGALAPITKLKAKTYGQEWTVTTRYFLSSHFLLLGVFSYAAPGTAIRQAFSNKIYPWMSYQGALFMFF